MAAERITLRAESSDEAVARAAEVLRAGGVAVLPAEGVYGYHALAASPEGVARLETLKPRAEGKGRIGLVGRPGDAYRWIAALPARGVSLIRSHWPGPLTLIFDASPAVPEALRGPAGTVALRCPGSDYLRAVVLAAGGLVLSTSANAPGDPAPTRVPEAESAAGALTLIVDAGSLSGTPSTVARVEGERVTILRSGAADRSGSLA